MLKKGISMFLDIYTLYGSLDNKFYSNIYFVRNKSIFEVYRMKRMNASFSYLSDNAEYFKVTELQQFSIK